MLSSCLERYIHGLLFVSQVASWWLRWGWDNQRSCFLERQLHYKVWKKIVIAVVDVFFKEYLRKPNNKDIDRLLAHGERWDFPNMLGSIDCMHWKWKNCPTAWKSQYCGHIHELTIILEAVASYDLWIWYAFFWFPGSNNDINMLEQSHIFFELAQGRAPTVNYSINGHDYTLKYYLANGIYPKWQYLWKQSQLHKDKNENYL